MNGYFIGEIKRSGEKLSYHGERMPSSSMGYTKVQAIFRGMDTLHSIYRPCCPQDLNEHPTPRRVYETVSIDPVIRTPFFNKGASKIGEYIWIPFL